MTCYLPPKRLGPGRPNPWRRMVADDLGLSLLVSEYDPLLLAAGIKAPRCDPTFKTRGKNHGWWAAQVTKRTPRTQMQRDAWRMRGTVEAKIVRQEVQDILSRYRNFGAVRVRST